MPRQTSTTCSPSASAVLHVYQGDDKRWLFRLKKADGTAFPLIGYTAAMQLRTDVADLVLTEVPVTTVAEVMDAAGGEIGVVLSSEQSTLLTEPEYVWDLQITEVATSWTTTVAGGTLVVTKEITRLVGP